MVHGLVVFSLLCLKRLKSNCIRREEDTGHPWAITFVPSAGSTQGLPSTQALRAPLLWFTSGDHPWGSQRPENILPEVHRAHKGGGKWVKGFCSQVEVKREFWLVGSLLMSLFCQGTSFFVSDFSTCCRFSLPGPAWWADGGAQICKATDVGGSREEVFLPCVACCLLFGPYQPTRVCWMLNVLSY